MENWKDIAGFEGRYQVSDLGRVRSMDHHVRIVRHGVECQRAVKGRVLKPGLKSSGHLSVAIGKDNSRSVHELVMFAFKGPRPVGADIAHNDGIPTNNVVENLRYATRSSNNKDRVHHGRTALSMTDVDRVRSECVTAPHGGKKKLALELGVSPSTISDVLAGRTYSHV